MYREFDCVLIIVFKLFFKDISELILNCVNCTVSIEIDTAFRVRALNHSLLCVLTRYANIYFLVSISTVIVTFSIIFFSILFALQLLHSFLTDIIHNRNVQLTDNKPYNFYCAYTYKQVLLKTTKYVGYRLCYYYALIMSHLFTFLLVTFTNIFIQANDF